MTSLKISIVTTVRNRADAVLNAMESVARQRAETDCRAGGSSPFELEYIVVDGGSTDGTAERIRAFAENHPDLSLRWISEPDRGLYDGLNKGIRMATGDVVGICHADDVLSGDDTVARIARAFAEGERETGRGPDAVYADVRFVRDGQTVEEMRRAPTVRYCTGRFFRNWMFRFATFPAHPSTFIRRDCFEKYGYYSLDYSICADFELMLRFFRVKGIRARYLPICTHVMRTGGISTKGARSNLAINRQDLRALKANGVWSCLPLIYLKYFAKIWGYVFKSSAR